MKKKRWMKPNGARCAWSDCDRPAVGKSKYCERCRHEARKAYMARVREQAAERAAREAEVDYLEDAITEAANVATVDSLIGESAKLRLRDGRTALARRIGREMKLETSKAVAAARVLREAGYECEVTL